MILFLFVPFTMGLNDELMCLGCENPDHDASLGAYIECREHVLMRFTLDGDMPSAELKVSELLSAQDYIGKCASFAKLRLVESTKEQQHVQDMLARMGLPNPVWPDDGIPPTREQLVESSRLIDRQIYESRDILIDADKWSARYGSRLYELSMDACFGTVEIDAPVPLWLCPSSLLPVQYHF